MASTRIRIPQKFISVKNRPMWIRTNPTIAIRSSHLGIVFTSILFLTVFLMLFEKATMGKTCYFYGDLRGPNDACIFLYCQNNKKMI